MVIESISHWCRPVTDRLVTNYDGYWNRYRWFVTILCVAAFADLASTIHFMLVDGIEYEVHPVIRFVSHIFGPVIGPVIGKCSQLMGVFLVTLYCRRLAGYIFFATSMLYSWAAWYNVWGHEMYEPLVMSILPL